MINKLTIKVCLLLIVVLSVFSCRKDGKGHRTTPLEFRIPEGWPTDITVFNDNPLTQEGFDLGKRLFYDGRLSKDGNFPCGSCHQQFAAFATFDHPFSHGFNNSFTTRNAPGLYNLAWHKEFHWDGGIVNLEVQPLAPITAPNEMAEEIQQVLEKLKVDPEYPQMFKKAFGDETINSQRMLKAITQFVASMVSADSKYDRVKRGQETFTAMEEAGYAVFSAKCASCHQEPLFTDQSYRNIGLPENPYLKDKGRMNITGRSADSLKFKVPSLRNVALTFPYAHDGRFYSIEQMIDHYRSGVQQSATVDPLVKNGIPISDVEKAQLVAFLRTLTDNSFINDPRFAENN